MISNNETLSQFYTQRIMMELVRQNEVRIWGCIEALCLNGLRLSERVLVPLETSRSIRVCLEALQPKKKDSQASEAITEDIPVVEPKVVFGGSVERY